MLAVDRINSYYGGAHILHDMSLVVGGNEVVALLGRNGAGKSTTMKSIMGLVRPKSGSVRLDEADITGQPPYRICRAGLGYVPEERRIFPALTVEENLEVGRRQPRAGAPTWTREGLFRLFPNLAERRTAPAGRLSGGEQQMLTIARTLMGNPDLLLLDEPSEGLAPIVVEQLREQMLRLRAEGIAILLCEQSTKFSLGLSSRAYILEKGRVCYQGTLEELEADEELSRTYLAV
jgi:branched-chain amino acid transport system ATP-binding protein